MNQRCWARRGAFLQGEATCPALLNHNASFCAKRKLPFRQVAAQTSSPRQQVNQLLEGLSQQLSCTASGEIKSKKLGSIETVMAKDVGKMGAIALAFSVGARASDNNISSKDISTTYRKLHIYVKRKYPLVNLEEFERLPHSSNRKDALCKQLCSAGADNDLKIIEMSQEIIGLLMRNGIEPHVIGVDLEKVRAANISLNNIQSPEVVLRMKNSSFQNIDASGLATGISEVPNPRSRYQMPHPSVQFENVTASAINISFSERLAVRVKQFSSSSEFEGAFSRKSKSSSPRELKFLAFGVAALAIAFAVMNASPPGMQIDEPVIFFVGIYILAFVVSTIYSFYKIVQFYLSKERRFAAGISGKEFISEGTKSNPSDGYFEVAYINNENIRHVARLQKGDSYLLSIGDVGIIVSRAGRIVDFLRSTQF